MPCRFASSGTVATSRSASRAILALNVASNFLRDLVISVLHPLRQSRTLHTLTFGPISGVHFTQARLAKCDNEQARAQKQKAGPNKRQESIGHEVMIAHGAPAALDAASEFIKDFGIGFCV